MNVEGMYSIYFIKIYKKIERSDSTFRNSLFDILRFCGSLFNTSATGQKSCQIDQKKVTFLNNTWRSADKKTIKALERNLKEEESFGDWLEKNNPKIAKRLMKMQMEEKKKYSWEAFIKTIFDLADEVK